MKEITRTRACPFWIETFDHDLPRNLKISWWDIWQWKLQHNVTSWSRKEGVYCLSSNVKGMCLIRKFRILKNVLSTRIPPYSCLCTASSNWVPAAVDEVDRTKSKRPRLVLWCASPLWHWWSELARCRTSNTSQTTTRGLRIRTFIRSVEIRKRWGQVRRQAV